MSTTTEIEWADKSWSPVVGCTQVSPGCANCYAMVSHNRRHKAYTEGKLQNMPQYAKPFDVVQLLPDRLTDPLRWRKPQTIFVNSQSDLFHDDIPDAFIDQVLAIAVLSQVYRRGHRFLVLTKRPARMYQYFEQVDRDLLIDRIADAASEFVDDGDCHAANSMNGMLGEGLNAGWPIANLWLGVTTENQRWANERLPILLRTSAAVHFASYEPALGPVDFERVAETLSSTPETRRTRGVRTCHHNTLEGREANPAHAELVASMGPDYPYNRLDWVITGAESGHGARPMAIEWVRAARDQCVRHGVKFMFKQDATPSGKKISLPVLDGRQWAETPAVEELVAV